MDIFRKFLKDSQNKITIDEVKRKIEKENRKIIIVGNKVYDITSFFESKIHPGGNDCLQKKNGTDCTIDLKFHSGKANVLLKKYFIGYLIK